MAVLHQDDYIHSKYDNVIDHRGPFRIVLIVSTPRSGSTMVSSLLFENGIGLPHEYVQPFQYLPLLAERIQMGTEQIDFSKLADFLIRKRTRNGYLGINIHAHHYPVWKKLKAFLLELKGCFFHSCILAKRLSVIDQAVSYYIAHATGNWGNFNNTDKYIEVCYDPEKFDDLLNKLIIYRAMAEQIYSTERSIYQNSEIVVYEQPKGLKTSSLEKLFNKKFYHEANTVISNSTAKKDVRSRALKSSKQIHAMGF